MAATPFRVTWYSCASISPNTLLITADEGRYVTYDLDRRTFVGRSVPKDVALTCVAIRSDGTWYIGDERGSVWTSSNQGDTWMEWPLSSASIVRVLIDGDTVVVVSADGGVFGDPLGSLGRELSRLRADQIFDADVKDGFLTAVGSRGFLALSSDGGQTWQTRQTGDTVHYTTTLRISRDTIVVGAMKGQLMVSHDNGVTWKYRTQVVQFFAKDTGQYELTNRSYQIAKGPSGRLVVAHEYTLLGSNSGEGLCRFVSSTNGGDSWVVNILESDDQFYTSWFGVPFRIAHKHADGSVFLIGSSPDPITGAVYKLRVDSQQPILDTLLQSFTETAETDAGLTRVKGEFGSLTSVADTLGALRFWRYFATTVLPTEYVVSADSGRTWISRSRVPLGTVAVTSANNFLFAVSHPCYVSRSTDFGYSWQPLAELPSAPRSTRVNSLHCTPEGTIILRYAFAGYDSTTSRAVSNAIGYYNNEFVSFPTPPALDTVSILDIRPGSEDDVWYIVSGKSRDTDLKENYLCYFDFQNKRELRFYINPHGDSADVGHKIHVVRKDSLLLSRQVDTIVGGRRLRVLEFLWLNFASGEFRLQAGPWLCYVGIHESAADVIDFPAELVFVFGGRSATVIQDIYGTCYSVAALGSESARLQSARARSIAKIGGDYFFPGSNQRIFRFHRFGSVTGVAGDSNWPVNETFLCPNSVSPSEEVYLCYASDNALIDVIDVRGNVMITTMNSHFSTVGLPAGMYIVRCTFNKLRAYTKLLVH